MKIGKVWLALMVVLLLSANAQASLEVIGKATYLGQDYNLIHMDGGPFGPITWLDYTRRLDRWQSQVNWAFGLGSQLTVTLHPGYTTSVNWSTEWRLPETVDGPYVHGNDGTTTRGYNITSSEMGYLFYKALGNKGYKDTSGNYSQPGWGLNDTGDFNNLQADSYWSGTESSTYPYNVWNFSFSHGGQNLGHSSGDLYALAVRPGDVSFNPVPLPAAVWLLGSGLLGLVGIRKKPKK